MANYNLGSGFLGSANVVEWSVEGKELIPDGVSCYRFTFNGSCKVRINNKHEIFVNGKFETNELDKTITSFVLLENGRSYDWIAYY